MNPVKHYCLLHLKFYGKLCFIIATMMFIPFFITSLCYDALEYDILFSCCASYGIWFLVFLVLAMWNIRFLRMIRRQEQKFAISFSDRNAKPLWSDSLSFLSDDWFIHAGSAAFYKDYIAAITWKRQIPGEGRSGYYLNVTTVDNRNYHLFIRSRNACEKIRKWWKKAK